MRAVTRGVIWVSLLSVVPASGQVDHTAPERMVDGLLEVPALFGAYACDRFVPRTVDVHTAASQESARIGVLETTRAWYRDDGSDCESIEVVFRDDHGEARPLRFMESGYEQPALIVSEESGPWFRIESDSPLGWIRPDAGAVFHPYEDLIRGSLAYVTPSWSGMLWPSPGVGTPEVIAASWRQHLGREATVEILDSRRVDQALWFHVRFDADYGCGAPERALPTLEGWLPAASPEGRPQLWFYSRGC